MTQLRCRVDSACDETDPLPRGSIYTTIMELGPERPSPLWFWGPNSIIVMYMDPLGLFGVKVGFRDHVDPNKTFLLRVSL